MVLSLRYPNRSSEYTKATDRFALGNKALPNNADGYVEKKISIEAQVFIAQLQSLLHQNTRHRSNPSAIRSAIKIIEEEDPLVSQEYGWGDPFALPDDDMSILIEWQQGEKQLAIFFSTSSTYSLRISQIDGKAHSEKSNWGSAVSIASEIKWLNT